MKIAYLSSSTVPSRTANSVHVMKMCNAFAKNGHQVTLFAREGTYEEENVYKYYGVRQNFRVEKIKVLGVKGINGIWCSYKYKQILKNGNKPDLIYARDLLGLLNMRSLKIPLVFEAHEPPASNYRYKLLDKLFKSESFERLVVISEALKQEYLKKFPSISQTKVLVAHDGADEIKNYEDDIEFYGGDFNVGYVGSLYAGRGIDVIIEAANNLPSFTFHVIGGSKVEIEKWKNLAKNSNVYFYGHVPPSKVQAYHMKMDVLLAPYQQKVTVGNNKGDTSKWMSPLKIFEYMAAGRPIIVSDLPVLHEVLNSNNAFFVESNNKDEWVYKLQWLRKNTEQGERIGKNSLLMFLKEHTWIARAKKVINHLGNESE